MTNIEQAEKLRQDAISLLIQAREVIDQKLSQLGYDGTERKNGRTMKCSRCGHEGHTVRTCPAPSGTTE